MENNLNKHEPLNEGLDEKQENLINPMIIEPVEQNQEIYSAPETQAEGTKSLDSEQVIDAEIFQMETGEETNNFTLEENPVSEKNQSIETPIQDVSSQKEDFVTQIEISAAASEELEQKGQIEENIVINSIPVENIAVTSEITHPKDIQEESIAKKPRRVSARKEKVLVQAENIEINEEFVSPSETTDTTIEKQQYFHITEEKPEIESPSQIEDQFYQHSKEELVEMMEKLVQNDDINSIKTQIALIKGAYIKHLRDEKHQKLQKYIEEGGIKEDYIAEVDQWEERFNSAFSIYKEKKIAYNEDQEKIKQENLKKKFQILDELKSLVNSKETLKKTYDDFKELQGKWKEIGMVPKSEVNNLWSTYHFHVEKFFEIVKINKELKDLDLKKNLEAKMHLCEKVEELLLETSITKSFKNLQEYHEEWKEIGPVPEDKRDEVWERFKSITEKINQRRREFYEKQYDEQLNNLLAKTALCEKAEEIVNSDNSSLKVWRERNHEINDLVKIWKTIGPAPKKNNAEIWNRFKTLIDSFFDIKKEYFGQIKDDQINNYNLKVNLCVQAEAIQNSTDWKRTTQDFLQLQEDWKKIGPVPKKNAEKIWKRFRTACDTFFNSKSSYFASLQGHEQENMEKKLQLIKRIENFQFTEDKSNNLEIIKNFQREWMEIGHVPIREKDKLHNTYRQAIDNRLDELKISSADINAMKYRSRIESIKDSPDSSRTLNKEKININTKISRLKEEIALWENNIGFISGSKKADLLREEFDKKINSAKAEVALLQAKLKMLHS